MLCESKSNNRFMQYNGNSTNCFNTIRLKLWLTMDKLNRLNLDLPFKKGN